jgi:hypothetical protein
MLKISINSWVIQDGNYPNFRQGEVRDFALEFFGKVNKTCSNKEKSCLHLSEAKYQVNAQVVYGHTTRHGCVRVSKNDKTRTEVPGHYEETVTVLDCGEFMAYRGTSMRPPYLQGDYVEGEVWIGVDPFFYKEDFCKRPEMPKLTSSWKIEKIEINTAPFVKVYNEQVKREVFSRDETKLAYREIEQIDVWTDDGGRADYILTCSKL